MRKKKFYGLFVGVDDYQHNSVPKLQGCVNDAKKILAFILNSLDPSKFDISIKKLFAARENAPEESDGLPTRTAILSALNSFSDKKNLQIEKGDIVFFFYAGHGSTEMAHPYFKEATGTLQTLVPYDARMDDTNNQGKRIRDILDKEIRLLIHKIWTNTEAEIIFIQDSCHSSGATRSADIEKIVNELNETIAKQEPKPEEKKEGRVKNPILTKEEMEKKEQASAEFKYTEEPPKKENTDNRENPMTLSKKFDEQIAAARLVPGDEEFLKNARAVSEIYGLDEKDLQLFENASLGYDALLARKLEEVQDDKEVNDAFDELVRAGSVTPQSKEAYLRKVAAQKVQKTTQPPFQEAFPQGEHIHISACGQDQFAYEVASTDALGVKTKGGVFTDTIVSLLRKTGGQISYHDLYQRAKIMIDGSFQQTPSIFVFGDESKRFKYFLSDNSAEAKGIYNLIYKGDKWVMDAGALLGLPVLRKNQEIDVIVYNANDPSEVYTNGKIIYIKAESSDISFGEGTTPNPNKIYLVKTDISSFISRKLNIAVERNLTISEDFEKMNLAGIKVDDENKADLKIAFDKSWIILYSKNESGNFVELYRVSGLAINYEELTVLAPDKAKEETDKTSIIATWLLLIENQKMYLIRPNGDKIEMPPVLNLENREIGFTKDAISYLRKSIEKNGQQTKYYLVLPTVSPFAAYLNCEEAEYFKNYINWTVADSVDGVVKEELDYVIRSDENGFFAVRPGAMDIPVFHASINQSKLEVLKMMNSLQQLCRWHNLLELKNPHQDAKKMMANMTFELVGHESIIKVKASSEDKAPFYELKSILNGNEVDFVAPKVSFDVQQRGFSFNFTFTNTSTNSFYLGIMVLHTDFSISSLVPGNSMIFPPFNASKGIKGQSIDAVLSMPGSLMTTKEKGGYGLTEVSCYLKVMIAEKRFDVTDWLQGGQRMPAEKIKAENNIKAESLRGVLERKKGEGAGEWLTFTIPVTLTTYVEPSKEKEEEEEKERFA